MITLQDLKAKGIVFEGARGVMAYDANGKTDFQKTVTNMAMDSALNPNVGFPGSFFQYVDPQITEVLFGVTNAARLTGGDVKQGSWEQEFYNFPVEEVHGGVTGYNDFDDASSVDVNYNYPVRELGRFQATLKYGDLESAKASVAKIELASRKQLAAAKVIAEYANSFYMHGISGKQNYGILNDPNLNAAISPASIGGNSTWASKIAANPGDAGNIVYNDINALFAELSSKNGGHVDANSRIILGISNSMASYLNTPNQFGATAEEMLKKNFPNLEVVQVPELSTAQGEQLYMLLPEVAGQQTCTTAFADKLRVGRLIPFTSSFRQKAVGTSWGFILKVASAVARMQGI